MVACVFRVGGFLHVRAKQTHGFDDGFVFCDRMACSVYGAQFLMDVLYSGGNGAYAEEFVRLGFRWGNTFSKYYDDHHFEKR